MSEADGRLFVAMLIASHVGLAVAGMLLGVGLWAVLLRRSLSRRQVRLFAWLTLGILILPGVAYGGAVAYVLAMMSRGLALSVLVVMLGTLGGALLLADRIATGCRCPRCGGGRMRLTRGTCQISPRAAGTGSVYDCGGCGGRWLWSHVERAWLDASGAVPAQMSGEGCVSA